MSFAKVSKFSFRITCACPLFGSPKDFGNKLPTYAEVIRCCLWERRNLAPTKGNKEPFFSDIARIVGKKVESLYQKASVPTVPLKNILRSIVSYHKKYQKLMKNYKSCQNNVGYKNKLNFFLQNAESTLFDVAYCKCLNFSSCSCEKSKKVPPEEQSFLTDQRSTRIAYIGGIDQNVTLLRQKRQERKLADASQRLCKLSSQNQETVKKVRNREKDIAQEGDNLFIPPKRIALKNTSVMSDRLGLSNFETALIATSVLQDAGLITENDQSLVIDKCKIKREKSKTRKEVQKENRDDPSTLLGLYFDGRKDKTLINTQDGNRFYRKEVKEEHIALVKEPKSKYLGHVTPNSGHGSEVADSIYSFLTEKELESVVALGSDGAPNNTGHTNGALRKLEEKFERPLHWFVCLLHFNELPLRHLFEYLDGK